MSFKEFLEDLKFEGEKPATKRAFWLVWSAVLITFGFAIGIQMNLKDLKREQLKNQYMLAALCNMPENQSACVAGLSDFEYDKD